MNPVIATVGGFEIRWYSVLILIGAVLGYLIAKKECRRVNVNTEFLFNMFFWTMICGIIGARLYYVAFNWSEYSNDYASILKIWEGGLAIHGGIIAGLLTMYFYCKKYNMRFARMTDIVAPSLLLAQAIGRWGNFFNSEAHGPATTLEALQSKLIIPDFVIKGMNINGTYYEPTFFYESLWCLIGAIVLMIVRRKEGTKVGTLTALYFMWYSVGRFFIETLRTDSLMIGGFKVAQVISVALFVIGLLWIMIQSRKNRFEDLYREPEKDIHF